MYTDQQLKNLDKQEFLSRYGFVLFQLILVYTMVSHHIGWGNYRFVMLTINTIRSSYFYVIFTLRDFIVYVLEMF